MGVVRKLKAATTGIFVVGDSKVWSGSTFHDGLFVEVERTWFIHRSRMQNYVRNVVDLVFDANARTLGIMETLPPETTSGWPRGHERKRRRKLAKFVELPHSISRVHAVLLVCRRKVRPAFDVGLVRKHVARCCCCLILVGIPINRRQYRPPELRW